MYELATTHKGLLVDVEHRFYGYSYPTTDTSLSNLQYLSAEQGLADLARIIAFVKQTYNTESSKVCFNSNYHLFTFYFEILIHLFHKGYYCWWIIHWKFSCMV